MKKEPGYLKLKIDAKTLRQVVSFCSWAKIPGQSLPPIRQKDLKTHYSIESIAAAVHWLPAFFASVRYSEMRKKENRRTMRKQLQRYREKIWMSGNIFFFMILCFFSWVSTSPQVRKINVNSFLNKKKELANLIHFTGKSGVTMRQRNFNFKDARNTPKKSLLTFHSFLSNKTHCGLNRQMISLFCGTRSKELKRPPRNATNRWKKRWDTFVCGRILLSKPRGI